MGFFAPEFVSDFPIEEEAWEIACKHLVFGVFQGCLTARSVPFAAHRQHFVDASPVKNNPGLIADATFTDISSLPDQKGI